MYHTVHEMGKRPILHRHYLPLKPIHRIYAWMHFILILPSVMLTRINIKMLILENILYHWVWVLYLKDKKEEIWPSPMTKPPTPTEMSKGQVTTQTTPQKSSIKQQLQTDLGRSVGVTKATKMVWLTDLLAHLPTNRISRVIKMTHI